MVIFVENDIQGICFLLLSVLVKRTSLLLGPATSHVLFCPFFADPLPPDLGRPFWMPPSRIGVEA